MMYLVEKAFIDKESKRLYEKGTVYITDKEERADKLKNSGFLGVELVVKVELPNDKDEEQLKVSSKKTPPEKEIKEKPKDKKNSK